MAFEKRRKRRLRSIKQHDSSDCGVACLVAVCGYYDYNTTVPNMRRLCNTDARGTSVAAMVDAAMDIGFDAKAVKAQYGSLQLTTLPAIAHVVTRTGSGKHLSHFVVLKKASGSCVMFMDPADGKVKKLHRHTFIRMWTGVLVLLYPNERFQRRAHERLMPKITEVISFQKKGLITSGIISLAISAMGVCLSVFVKELIDEVIPRNDLTMANVVSLLMITVLVMQMVLTNLKNNLILKVVLNINRSLIGRYYSHVMSLPVSFFHSMRAGEIISRVNDAVKISAVVSDAAVNIVVDIMIIVISIALMFLFNSSVALMVACIIPVYIVLFVISNAINKKRQRPLLESAAAFESQLVESISAATTIRQLGIEGRFIEKNSACVEELAKHMRGVSIRQSYVQSTADIVTRLFTVLLLWIGTYHIVHGKLSTGELVAFYTLLGYFSMPVLYLLNATKGFGEAQASARRLFDILEMDPAVYGKRKIDAASGINIELENVAFRYGGHEPVLKDVTLSIKSGTISGIRGASGSGKSTLLSLLINANRPTSGRIAINDVDLSELDKETICSFFSIVPQQATLFNMSIEDNITIGCEKDDAKLQHVCELLDINSFTDKMPHGRSTVVAEGAANLSGGQKQRIAIARALYRSTPVLVLDEATTSIDEESEQKIMQTIEWYKNKGNTVIIVAHSESTLKICDNIAVLENGIIR